MYTVKQLARLAGVTPRTLHYYDEIGLLKPSLVGDNGYRYYGEQEVLRLQQILLFRQMELPLGQIAEILGHPDFDIERMLGEHRRSLLAKIGQLEQMVLTVDETVLYLKGQRKMDANQFFSGLSEKQQAAYEQEAMKKYDPETVKESHRKWKGYSDAEKQDILDEGKQIYRDLLAAMPEGAGSDTVQAVIQHWRDHMSYFWTPELEQLTGLADLYNEDARFKANFDALSPELAGFMREAVQIYVEKAKKRE